MSNTMAAINPPPGRLRRRGLRWWYLLPLVLAPGAVITASRIAGHGATAPVGVDRPPHPEGGASAPRVEVIRPGRRGIERVTVQPGSVHAFESVDLHAMVSGFLKSQGVDIGSRVKRGQVLAEIDVPREEKAAAEAAALLEQSKARARQADARVAAMAAERDTAAATLAQTEADVDRLVAGRRLAEGAYGRIRDLHGRDAVPRSVLEEHRNAMESATAAEKTGRLAVQTARARLEAADARVEQARADVAEAKAAIAVAEARLGSARVDLAYARITAPFDGVITRRSYHPGAFIPAAPGGGQVPLLTVARTDLMRVLVRVPDRDAVLADPGDPAVVTFDGLGGRSFRGTVARVAESEDHQTRAMRVEIDLPNPDGLLRDGMYGRASITLEPASTRLTVPVACVHDRSAKGDAALRVVRDGKVHRVDVRLGADDGVLAEVASGIGPDEVVVLRSGAPLEPGMAVAVKPAG